MKLHVEKEEVLQAARAKFPDKYIDVDTIDFYIPDIKEGEILIDGIETPFYISTNYVYEDRIVLGNHTRYKVELTLVDIKANQYEVIYDSYGKSFVAYEEEGIKLVPYEDFYEEIKDKITNIKK